MAYVIVIIRAGRIPPTTVAGQEEGGTASGGALPLGILLGLAAGLGGAALALRRSADARAALAAAGRWRG